MSIALESKVRALEARVKALEDARLPDEPDAVLAYTRKFGQAPHHRMKPETIEAKLRE